jgi:hypothetical protein
MSALTLVGAVLAADGNDEALRQIEELRRQNEQLAQKVAQLEKVASDDGAWLTEERAAQIRSLVQDVVADADTRSSLQADGATAGWNKGFFLASADGSFRLNIKGQVQVRWAYNSRDVPSGPLASGQSSVNTVDDNWGFENRRTKIAFTGHIIDPTVTFEVQPVWSRSSGSNSSNANGSIENIWIQKAYANGIAIRAGQFKAPYLREELVSSTSQLAVERSMLNDYFSAKFTQGVQMEWEQELFRLQGFYGDGFRANGVNASNNAGVMGNYNGSYVTDSGTNRTNYAFAGRAELKLAGNWRQFRDLSSFRGEDMGILLGVSGMAQSLRPTPTTATSAKSMWGMSVDATLDLGGANLFGYFVYRDVALAGTPAVRGGGTDDALGQFGFLVQGGFFVIDELELFARYEYGDSDGDQYRVTANSRNAELERLSVVTVGVNFYPMGSANKDLKWTTDIGFALDPVGDFASSGTNWLQDVTPANGTTEDGQWVVRSQIQLLF